MYIMPKAIDISIDISYRLKTLRSYGHWLETSKSVDRNQVPSPNTKQSLIISVRTSISIISTFGTFAEKHFLVTFRICVIPYSRKLTHNDFNAKEINAKKINANDDQ